MCCPSWVMLCLFTPSIDCVYVLPVLSYFVFFHAKYWLCICVARLEFFCVCSRQVLIVYMCYSSWVIMRLFTPSIDCAYALFVLSYFVVFHAKYWLCICVAPLELFSACSRLVLIVYMCCPSFCVWSRLVLIVYMCFPSWVILCLFTPSIDCVYVLPVLSYFVLGQA